jgi:hypothetical protein
VHSVGRHPAQGGEPRHVVRRQITRLQDVDPGVTLRAAKPRPRSVDE